MMVLCIYDSGCVTEFLSFPVQVIILVVDDYSRLADVTSLFYILDDVTSIILTAIEMHIR